MLPSCKRHAVQMSPILQCKFNQFRFNNILSFGGHPPPRTHPKWRCKLSNFANLLRNVIFSVIITKSKRFFFTTSAISSPTELQSQYARCQQLPTWLVRCSLWQSACHGLLVDFSVETRKKGCDFFLFRCCFAYITNALKYL